MRVMWGALCLASESFDDWPGFEHVHLELQRGRDRKDIEDPLPRIVGCFDGTKQYRADRLVLTYPVKC
jgi:hypothetical protein